MENEGQERRRMGQSRSLRSLAEIIGEYLRKGSQIYIEGRLQTRDWKKDGVKRYTTEVVISNMQILDGKFYRDEIDNKAADMPDEDIPF